MKIFYLANTIYNSAGMERVLITKANLLASEYGYDVVIVTNHQKGRPTFFPLDPSVRHIDLDVNTHLPWTMPLYMRRLEALIEKEKPDIVDSLCFRELTYMPRLKGDCIKMAEFHFSHETYKIKGQFIKLRRYEKAVGKLDCFVTLTKEDKAAWAPYCKHLEQIYNPTAYTPGELAPLENKRCISGGRFEKQKNYGEMIRVWKIVHQKHPDWILDLYGNGDGKRKIRAMVKREGLQDSVFIHPATKDIKSRMMESSIYLMTSLYEGFPMVLVETAAIGLPCVAMSCPCGPGEFIEDGVSGFTVPPADTAGMAEKLSRLMDDKALRQSMGREINRKAGDYTPEIIMPQWDSLFKRLVSEKGIPGKGNGHSG